ncbi:MAG: tetratricopeptide repeat protein, partial [Nitrospirae bacterium]|nr:tetratricopeptide repeat protein [Nitrospirota bacterium]
INEATYERSQALNAGQNLGTNKNNQVAGETLFEISKVGNMLTAAYGHFKQGDFQTSIQMFTDSLNVTPTPVAYYFIALCYQSMKDVNKAIVSLETGTRAFNDFELWKALGLAYSELGDKEKARKAFTAANAINPNDRQIKFFLEEK